MSSASSSDLRMGQGLGFGRVKRRASSPGHFLWEWSSRRGSSSASRWGRFRGEVWILASVFRRLSVPPVLRLEGQRCAALGGCCLEGRVCDSCRMPPLLFLLPLCLLVVQHGVGSFSFSLFFVWSLVLLWLCICGVFWVSSLLWLRPSALVRCLALALRSNLFVSRWFYGADTLSFHFRVSAWFFLSI